MTEETKPKGKGVVGKILLGSFVIILAFSSGLIAGSGESSPTTVQDTTVDSSADIKRLEDEITELEEEVEWLEDDNSTLEDKIAKQEDQPKAAKKPAPKPEPEPAEEAQATTFTDGTYLVGIDIQPGQYRGEVTSSMGGYWARLSGTSGELDDVIANDGPSGPFVLTISASDNAVELSNVKITKM